MVSSASIIVPNDPLTTKKKKSSGRKKIDIKKIEKSNHLQVTFSKRRTGLFKKASELCVLTGAQVAIFVNSPAGRMYVFGHPDVDALIERSHLQEINNVSLPLLPENNVYFNQRYEEVLNEFDAGQSEMIESAGSNESDDEFFRGFDAEKTWNEMIMSTGSNESGSNDVLGVEELLRESDAGNTPNEMIVSSGGNDDRLWFDECIDGMITSTRSNESGSNDHDVIGLEELLSESDAGIVSSGGKDDGLGWFDECIDGMGVEELENSLSKLQQAKYNIL